MYEPFPLKKKKNKTIYLFIFAFQAFETFVMGVYLMATFQD